GGEPVEEVAGRAEGLPGLAALLRASEQVAQVEMAAGQKTAVIGLGGEFVHELLLEGDGGAERLLRFLWPPRLDVQDPKAAVNPAQLAAVFGLARELVGELLQVVPAGDEATFRLVEPARGQEQVAQVLVAAGQQSAVFGSGVAFAHELFQEVDGGS